MEFRRRRRAPVEIGLIPMIDVLLVLLFFFMLATTFRHHTDIKINLPQADGSEEQEQSASINLFISAAGEYALASGIGGGKAKSIAKPDVESLKAELAQLPPQSKLLPFIINADGKTPHQAVVTALDAANQTGFHHLTFAINPPDKK
jgi:biopolymer transport protein ExbD